MRVRAATRGGGPSSMTTSSITSVPVKVRSLAPNHLLSGSCAARPSTSIISAILYELEPVEGMGPEREQIGQFAYAGKTFAAQKLDRIHPCVSGHVQLRGLSPRRQIVDAQDDVVRVAAQIGEYGGVVRMACFEASQPEYRMLLSD